MKSGYMFDKAFLRIGQLRLGVGNLLVQNALLNRRIEQVFLLQLGLERAIAFGLFGLQLHGMDLAFDLTDDIRDPQQVLLSPLEFPFGHKLPALVFASASRLFDYSPPIFGLGIDQFINPSLLDNRICLTSDPGSQEKLDDVFQATRNLVDGVLRLPRTEEPAGHHNFTKTSVFHRTVSVFVFEDQRHFGHAGGSQALAAVEYHVLHLVAAEMAGALLAHSPA